MKNLLIIIVLVAAYAGALFVKNIQVEKKKNVYVPTIYDLQMKAGIPVEVASVEKGKFQEFLTLSGALERTGELKSSVAPSVRRRITVGSDAILELENGKRIRGKITSVTGPNLLTGLYEVTSLFSYRPKRAIHSATLDVPVKEISGVILVPRESVNNREKTPVVFTLSGNTIQKKTIAIAGANAEKYWVKSGLTEREKVVVSDTRYFKGGEKVNPSAVKKEEL